MITLFMPSLAGCESCDDLLLSSSSITYICRPCSSPFVLLQGMSFRLFLVLLPQNSEDCLPSAVTTQLIDSSPSQILMSILSSMCEICRVTNMNRPLPTSGVKVQSISSIKSSSDIFYAVAASCSCCMVPFS